MEIQCTHILEVQNLVEDGNCVTGGCGFLSGHPMLDILYDNGGPTDTHALEESSPAIDAGDPEYCPDTDQRVVTRPQGTGYDIGAFELEQDLMIFMPLFMR